MKFIFQIKVIWIHTNFLSFILTIYCKYLLFCLFSRAIHMHIPIFTGVHNRGIISWKKVIFCYKCTFLSLISSSKVTRMPSFFYIFAIKRKSLLFQFLSRGIRPHIAILTRVQNERICGSEKKNGHILHKITFEA